MTDPPRLHAGRLYALGTIFLLVGVVLLAVAPGRTLVADTLYWLGFALFGAGIVRDIIDKRSRND